MKKLILIMCCISSMCFANVCNEDYDTFKQQAEKVDMPDDVLLSIVNQAEKKFTCSFKQQNDWICEECINWKMQTLLREKLEARRNLKFKKK